MLRKQLAAWLLLLAAVNLFAEPVKVRYREGIVHGFLVLRSQQGEVLADGDGWQIAKGNQVTAHLTLQFRDGSLHDETTVFYQGAEFQLISDHLVQKGPSFPHPIETSITKANGLVTVRTTGSDGKEQNISTHLTLPPDVANGLTLTFLKNIRPTTPKTTVSMVAITPKPRLVKLVITPGGETPFALGATKHNAIHYLIKVDIGGVAGAVAPVVGKQPPDMHVWFLYDGAPVFLRMEGPLYYEGPIWQLELASPTWNQAK